MSILSKFEKLKKSTKIIILFIIMSIGFWIFLLSSIHLEHRLGSAYRYTAILDKELVRNSQVFFIPKEYKYHLKVDDRYYRPNNENYEYKDAYAYSTIDYNVGDIVPYFFPRVYNDKDNQPIVEIERTEEKYFPIRCIAFAVHALGAAMMLFSFVGACIVESGKRLFSISYKDKRSSKAGTILDIAVYKGIIEKVDDGFNYDGSIIAKDRDNAKIYLEKHPEICAEVEKRIRDNIYN